ncbi:MAG: tRNA uridine-5-carboxymethylaminomethyl(34) synthesis enzyme MnmG, partial [Helicobacteraceae bacterium]|nr:tRNA uridine-5-carboxymethylaminomethyl(34) synthesis enzyme MnmG [Helicobacteraceae bacterium]
MKTFEIIIAGGGHAGVEAAAIAAKMGAKTLLVTPLISQIAAISCNPAIGGLGKSHLAKEADILGGAMGVLTDAAALQYRVLNESKGEAVRGTRVQIDMDAYPIAARDLLLRLENLTISQDLIEELIVENGWVAGVITRLGIEYRAKAAILCGGTFLNGLVHIGEKSLKMGRIGEMPSINLAEQLRALGFEIGRLKTGTCPRVDAKSIDFAALERQANQENPKPFSIHTRNFAPRQLPCYLAYTNAATHEIISGNFHRAPLFTGQILGTGPRYCPSIEDKISRFADRASHQIFVEPMSREANEYYLNGLSTSLPRDVQEKFVRSMAGF